MAEQELNVPEGGKKKSKMMLIIIVVSVLVLGGGGAGAYFFLFSGGDEAAKVATQSGSTPESEMENDSGKAIYVSMPRPFQFNAPGVTRERLVQIEVQLMVRGLTNEERAKRHIPMIEGTLITVFSASNADELVTEEGKADLRSRSSSQVRQVLNQLEGNPVVEEVLFTGFVMQ